MSSSTNAVNYHVLYSETNGNIRASEFVVQIWAKEWWTIKDSLFYPKPLVDREIYSGMVVGFGDLDIIKELYIEKCSLALVPKYNWTVNTDVNFYNTLAH